MATKPVFKDTDQGPVIRRKLNEMGDMFEEGMVSINEVEGDVILAKQYRDEAEGFKDISVTKAGEAEGYASSARTSELAAKESELASAQSESNARASELASKASETAAALSETNAKASEIASKASETAAAESELAASLSEGKAKDSEIASALSETNAKASELAAKESETASALSETNAKTSETNAKASETASALSETNAKTSETNAKASETASALSETNAKASELAASASETNSALSESNAKASELLAKDWAIKEGDTVDGVDYSAKHYAQIAQNVVAGGTVVVHEPTGTIEFEGIGNPSFPLKANFVGTKSDVGLDQVDNTSDLDKPISTAMQAELDLKAGASELADLEDSITDTLVPLINTKVDKVTGKGLSDENYTLTEKTKLAGVATGATKNATDAQLRDRTTHTGVQPISSVSGLQTALDGKVDKQVGYGLSQENFTPAEKSKLASLEGSKFKGEYVSLAALKAAHSSPEVGSYAYIDAGVGEVVTKYIWDSSDAEWVKQQGEIASLTPAEIKSLYEGNPDTNAFTDSEKTKLAGVQAGATANATNAQLRDRATHTGEQAISTVTGLQSALDSKVDLTDSRLTNSREWTGSTVSQAEAEAGTATTRRAWTAQRVRQAIAAWYLTVSSAFTRTLLSRTNAAQVRDDLQLGTAATRDAVSSSTDTSGGNKVITQGWMGLGLRTLNDNSNATRFAYYTRDTKPLDYPSDWYEFGGIWSIYHGYSGDTAELVVTYNNETFAFRGERRAPWREVFHTGNILKTTGDNDDFPMSQKAVTDALNTKITGDKSLGVGQTWQDMTASRKRGVTYTNTTGRPIQLFINHVTGGSSWTFDITIAGMVINYVKDANPVVPAGVTYKLDWNGVGDVKILELR